MLAHQGAKRPAVTSGLCYSVTQGMCPKIGLAFCAAFSYCSLAARGLATITLAPLWHYCFPGFFSPPGVRISDHITSNMNRPLVSIPKKDISLLSSWFGKSPKTSVNICTKKKKTEKKKKKHRKLLNHRWRGIKYKLIHC